MGQCSSKPPATSGDAEVPRATVTAVVTQREPGVSEKVQEASLEESEGGDAADLPVSNSSYDEADIHATQASQKKAAVLSSSSDGDANGKASVDPSLPSNASGSNAEVQDVLKEYTLLAEMLQYSPYAVTLIDVEQSHQPFVFANQVRAQHVICKSTAGCLQRWQEIALVATPETRRFEARMSYIVTCRSSYSRWASKRVMWWGKAGESNRSQAKDLQLSLLKTLLLHAVLLGAPC